MDLAKKISNAPQHRKQALAQVADYYRYNIVGPELQWGPSADVCAAIQLGARPVELAPQLTKKEAALWAYQTEHKSPADWLWAHLCEMYPDLAKSHSRHVEVMRWAARMMSSKTKKAAMYKPRVMFGEDLENGDDYEEDGYEDGRETQNAASVLQRLDEIRPNDLSESPSETLQKAINRQMKEKWDGPDELRPWEEWMDRLPKGCRVLRTWPELFKEGLQMRHCVASYAEKIHDKTSVIVSIVVQGGRSTAEYRNGRLVQHQSFARSEPPATCWEVARRLESGGLVP